MTLRSLRLTHFRSHRRTSFDIEAQIVVLTGPNGVGKTNVLEALSLFAPGKGLRRARVSEMQSYDSEFPWSVAACFDTTDLPLEIQIESHTLEKRRTLVNGAVLKRQLDLAEFTHALWLTPQMDTLFYQGQSAQRLFLDRLVAGYTPGYTAFALQYHKALRERNRLLQEGAVNRAWFESLEQILAHTGAEITRARFHFLEALNTTLALTGGAFPQAKLHLEGMVEEWFHHVSLEDLQRKWQDALAQARTTNGPSVGCHRSILNVYFISPLEDRVQAANVCSTGEQKALLLAIILATAKLQRHQETQRFLLLDEVVAHLDAQRRATLFEALQNLQGIQVWATGTDPTLFEAWTPGVQYLSLP